MIIEDFKLCVVRKTWTIDKTFRSINRIWIEADKIRVTVAHSAFIDYNNYDVYIYFMGKELNVKFVEDTYYPSTQETEYIFKG